MKTLTLLLLASIFAIGALASPAAARVHEVRKGPTCVIGSDLLVGVKDADCKAWNAKLEDLANGRIRQGCWFAYLQQYAESLNEDQCAVLDGVWDWIRFPAVK